MKRALLVVDLQREFEDTDGKFNEILKWVQHQSEMYTYDKIIATVCGNSINSPFYKYTGWDKMLNSEPRALEFTADVIIEKKTYGLPYRVLFDVLPANYVYDIIGYNTDACVLKVVLDMADAGRDIRILTNYCYSSSGEEAHKRGVEVLKSLLSSAVFSDTNS